MRQSSNYKRNHIQVLDNFLEKLNPSEKKNTLSNPQNTTRKITETNKEQKYNSIYNNINNKSATSVNHNNLTALT